MKSTEYSHLRDKHAFLSPSQNHWLNYDLDKLTKRYNTLSARERGTELHKLAQSCIEYRVKLAHLPQAMNRYVNDAIGFKMDAEVVLFYSVNAFGTADAISFRNNLLRIHDLKTGAGRPGMTQLEIYAALFCLRYGYDPRKIDIELRIYFKDKVILHEPTKSRIQEIMDKIVSFDKRIEELKEMEASW